MGVQEPSAHVEDFEDDSGPGPESVTAPPMRDGSDSQTETELENSNSEPTSAGEEPTSRDEVPLTSEVLYPDSTERQSRGAVVMQPTRAYTERTRAPPDWYHNQYCTVA